MTTQPEADTNGDKNARQFSEPVREIAAAVSVGAVAVLLLGALISLVPFGYRFEPNGFSNLASSRFGAFVNILTIGLPVLAVLLATHVEPRVSRARTITIAALAELVVAGFFGAFFGMLIGLFGDLDGPGFKSALESLLGRIAMLGLLAVALLFVYRVWRGLYHVPRPPAPPPGYYGYPQQPGYPPPGGPQPGQPYGQPGFPQGYPQQQPGYPPAGYPQPGYGQPPQEGFPQQPGQPGQPQPGQPQPGQPQPGQPGQPYGQPGQPQFPAGQPGYPPAYGQPTSAPPTSGPPAPPTSGPPAGDEGQRTQYLPPVGQQPPPPDEPTQPYR